jgi:hypothetical protein
MAKMLGIHASVMRGSIGGNTWTANGQQAIVVRSRVSPTNPQTTRQTQIRSDFGGAAADWNSLTDAERRAWDTYAATVRIPGPLGDVTPTGRQMFVGNIGTREYLITRGETFTGVVDTAPTDPGRLVLQNLEIIAPASTHTGFQLQVTNPNPEAIMLYAWVSPKQNAGRNTYHGKYDSETLDTVTIAAAGSGVIAFDLVADDDVHFVKCRAIVQNGEVRTSAQFVLRGVVSTTV